MIRSAVLKASRDQDYRVRAAALEVLPRIGE